MSRNKPSAPLLMALLATSLLAGCSRTMDKLQQVGNAPALDTVENPTTKPDYEPMTWPLPDNHPATKQYANSLWQPGARAFFRDQRAQRVGDIVRVVIKVNDKAETKNETERKRPSTESVQAPAIFGLENTLFKRLPGTAVPSNLLEAASNTNSKGTGTVKRQEIITTQVAALITQILPNGNMVIEGKQEMVVNYDLREISIHGVIRPQDISSDNSIESTQVAEARITYGGRGQLMDVQQPRWGSQVVETLSPF
ncbi:MAG: flagellar basal body L-ring protein FlgH [Rickettsiales bacterium]|nr:flagellar basal body L-ring protein FlgH [Rickettsiales bacterium]